MTAKLVAVLLAFTACCLVEAPTSAASSGRFVVRVAPSGGDDAQQLQAALDAASAAGPGAVVQLAAGTFHVGRPLIVLNFSGTIRGAGMRKTTVLADGSSNADGLFQSLPSDEAAALRILSFPSLFTFTETDRDRSGQAVNNRRSLRLTMQDLTLGALGRTVAHYDVNENADTQRLFSLVWIFGYRSDWTNSQNQTPGDLGFIDAEHAQVSTVRASFHRVHFDGQNRAHAENDPGGPFDPNPDVRNALGIEGGIALLKPPPDPIFFFKPINAALLVDASVFTDLPGQAGIFAPQIVGRDDPAWTFGPDAVAGSLKVTETIFEDSLIGFIGGDLSDVAVTIARSEFRHLEYGALLNNNFQSTDGAVIGYPPSVRSEVTIKGSTFEDSGQTAIWMDEYLGPSLVDFKVSDNDFVLAGPSHAGVVGFAVDNARIVDNDFSGEGYAAVVAFMSAGWRIRGNDFCDLDIPPSAPSGLGLPANDTQAPIVILESTDIRTTGNHCP